MGSLVEPMDRMMKFLEFDGTFNNSLLFEELFAAHPHWVTGEDEDRQTQVTFSYRPRWVGLWAPEKDAPEIDRIVAIHDYTKKSQSELLNEKYTADSESARVKLRDLGFTDDEIDVIK